MESPDRGVAARSVRVGALLLPAAACTVGLVFLVAAIGKAEAASRFQMVIGHVFRGLGIRGLPIYPFVLGVVAIESFIGVCYLLNLAGPAVHRLTLLVLGAFSVLLVWMWVHPPPEGCGCVGFWLRPLDPRHELVLGLARNFGLIGCIIAAKSNPRTVNAPIRRGRQGAGGFTLIETLLVIAVLALLLALALPAISRARSSSRRTVELSDARQVYAALIAYSSDEREYFPFCGTPGDIQGPLTINGSQIQYSTAFFTGQSKLFVNLICPNYLSTIRNITTDDPAKPEGQLPVGVVRSEVWLTYTAFSKPAYWTGRQPPDVGASLLRGGRWADVEFPSSKGVLLDLRAHNRGVSGREPHDKTLPWGIVWADGSAVRKPVDVNVTYRTVERPAAMFNWPVLATEGGLGGRDFEPAPGASNAR
jgi:prepilin-type N-terminal cleavage/methylation domain-containing protein